MNNSQNVFKTQQELRKEVSELQGMMSDFGIHLISIH